jgi:hypothetical protein
MTIDPEHRAKFEEMGEPRVRLIVATTDGFPYPLNASAIEWLAEWESLERKINEAAKAEQDQIAKTTKNAAIAAIAIAVLSLVISIASWLFPRH